MSRPDMMRSSCGRSTCSKGKLAILRLVKTAMVVLGLSAGSVWAQAHTHGEHSQGGSATIYGQPGSPILIEPPTAFRAELSPSPAPYGAPVEDRSLFWHVLFNQLEGRTNGPDAGLRWDGEAWMGTDYNRVWVKSEGFLDEEGRVEDGSHEVLYSRSIHFLRSFDWQAGLRYDGDASRDRLWGAFGVEGLAPGFFETEAAFYARDAGHFAGRVSGSYDLRLTNRLIAQPQIELNFYSKHDPARGLGSGLAELDTGLRLRYEFSRKFAPYIGVAYDGTFGETATFTRQDKGIVNDVRFIFGVRVWY
jgi:copper resistance protein B